MRGWIVAIGEILFFNSFCFSQECLCAGSSGGLVDPPVPRQHILQRKPVSYPYVREADVMWNKRVWRVIPLIEKMNLPFKYPMSKSSRERCSLIDVIMEGVLKGCLTAYHPADDEFSTRMTIAEVEALGGGTDTIEVQNPNPPYNMVRKEIKKELKRDDVVEYRLKEDWFFDRQRSVMEVRIMGVAPIMNDYDANGNYRGKKVLFWIYFPEARMLFAKSEAFNRFNDAERRSYDDVFMKRFFSSYIIKESNVYDRRVSDYKQGIDAMLEAGRIKNEIELIEHDVWEF